MISSTYLTLSFQLLGIYHWNLSWNYWLNIFYLFCFAATQNLTHFNGKLVSSNSVSFFDGFRTAVGGFKRAMKPIKRRWKKIMMNHYIWMFKENEPHDAMWKITTESIDFLLHLNTSYHFVARLLNCINANDIHDWWRVQLMNKKHVQLWMVPKRSIQAIQVVIT